MKFQDLKNSLKNKIEPVYLINGEDEFLKNYSIQLIKNAVIKDDINLNVLSTDELDIKKFIDICNMYSFFGKKVVVLKESDGQKNSNLISKIKEYIKTPNSSTVLIIVAMFDSKFFDNLKGLVVEIDCSRLSDDLLIRWIVNKVGNKKKISIEAAKLLIDYCNHYLSRIDVEIDKLVAYCEQEIKKEDIQLLVNKDLEYNIFEFAESLGKGNKVKAYQIFEDLINDKKTESSVLSLIQNHFRRLFYVSISRLNNQEIAQYLGIKEFAVKKLKEQVVKFSPIILKNIVQQCEIIDNNIKNGESLYLTSVKNLVNYILINVK